MGENRFDFRLLGAVEARADGRAIALGGPRQRALLALLLLEPGRPVPSARLVEELWESRPPAGADTTLRSYVSRLRRALGPEVLPAAETGYVAVVARDAIDLHRFERLAREGRDALEQGAPGVAAEALHAALALWEGPALADVAAGGALAAEARRLEELRLACLEDRLEADLALGRHGALVPELRLLVEQEPLRERRWRLLALALYRNEQQADALAACREARRVLDEELGLEPGPELRELERAILRHELDAAPPVSRRQPALPAGTTSFVGRERELDELAALLREHRLVTVTGLGGTGKTRVALELARRRAGTWAGGVAFVDLTALADAGPLVAAVAAALGADHSTVESVVERLRRTETLLLLDNCEHLVGAAAELAGGLLRSCPDLRVLATSRVPLRAEGEAEFRLEPLPAAEAVRLFVDRAAAVRRDVDADADAIEGICRELDGLPLAIELAAARARVLSPAEIAARLDDRFRFLRAWHRVADPRHRTLQTTMDWSHELLGEDERLLLRRLAVFAGGADLAAVADVCVDGGEEQALDLLEGLVEASLVVADTGASTRYRLLETVREYAAGKLADDPEAERVRRRHAEHYLRIAQAANLAVEATGRSGPQQHEPVLREQHNLRAALDWASTADVALALELMVALENFWIAQALEEGEQRYRALLARADGVDRLLLAQATRDHASCLDVLSDFAAAKPLYERSRELYAELDDELGVAYLDYRIAIVLRQHDGDYRRARELCERSLGTFRRLGDRSGELQVLGVLGAIELAGGDADRGRELLRTSVQMARDAGWHWWETRHQGTLAVDALERGVAQEAEERGRRVVQLGAQTGNRQDVLYGLAILARAAALEGDAGRALALWSTVEAMEDGPGRMGRFDRVAYARAMPEEPLPPPLPLADAVALALAG